MIYVSMEIHTEGWSLQKMMVELLCVNGGELYVGEWELLYLKVMYNVCKNKHMYSLSQRIKN